jgi:ubiquinol oxidase
MSVQEFRDQGYTMNPSQWLAVCIHYPQLLHCQYLRLSGRQIRQRILFLESTAGVPGMVGACLRHLRSLRLMRRDNAWINTLLQGECMLWLRRFSMF